MSTIKSERMQALLAKARSSKAKQEAMPAPINKLAITMKPAAPQPSTTAPTAGGIDFKAKLAMLTSQSTSASSAPIDKHPVFSTKPLTANQKTKIKELATSNTLSRIATLRAKLATRTVIGVDPAKKGADHSVTATYEDGKITSITPTLAPATTTDRYGQEITYNSQQQQFISTAAKGENCILIGAAGTGKTTCMKGTINNLIDTGQAGVLQTDGHKYLQGGTPGVLVVSYTRRAVNNIRANMSDDMKANCITIHKLLEYAPVFSEVFDEDTGLMRKTMTFQPSRNAINPLPSSIHTIVIEEASMTDLLLWSQLIDALGHKVQWILLGDINQLPPVFGPAILGYKLLQWEVVELTQVYRQALESPIIRLAHRVLRGEVIQPTDFEKWKFKKQLTLHAWKKKLIADDAVRTLAAFFCKAYDNKAYDPDEDMILIPYNKACGTLELNKYIANHLARTYNRTTHEVVAGFNKHYFTEGDKVLYEKEDAEIVSITPNAVYDGTSYQPASKTLDYWGYNPNLANETGNSAMLMDMDIDDVLAQTAEASEERVRKASHVITVRLADSGTEVSIDSAAEVNALIHAYTITVHKAQGSEWKKVFLCLHQSHATMLGRELLYTAVTRAKEELYVICEPESFIKGINSQRIKGNSLEEKAEHFKGKLDSVEADLLTYIYKG